MFFISFISEILTLATGLILFKKIRPVALKLVILVLLLTVINEGFAYFNVYKDAGVNKSIAYNVFFVIEMIIFFFVYFLFYKEVKFRKIVTVIFGLSLLAAFYFLKKYGIEKFNPYFLNCICFCLLAFGFLYYYFIYVSPEINYIKRDPIFWFSTGIVVANFIHLLFVNAIFIDSFRNNPDSKHVFQVLNTIGNLFYYGCLITSFICSSNYRRPVGT